MYLFLGYFVRKYVFNYYAQKEYLMGLAMKNEQVRKELSEYEEKMRETEQRLVEEKERLTFEEEAKRKHYMLSTETARGPYFPTNRRWVCMHVCTYVSTYVHFMSLQIYIRIRIYRENIYVRKCVHICTFIINIVLHQHCVHILCTHV